MIALTRKPQLERISRESKSFVLSQSASMKPIRRWFYHIWNWFFQAEYREAKYALIQFSFGITTDHFSLKYSWLYCKYISLKIIHISPELFPSIRNAFAHSAASIVPLLIFWSNDKDGNGKSWSKTLYNWIDVYLNSKLYLMILAE